MTGKRTAKTVVPHAHHNGVCSSQADTRAVTKKMGLRQTVLPLGQARCRRTAMEGYTTLVTVNRGVFTSSHAAESHRAKPTRPMICPPTTVAAKAESQLRVPQRTQATVEGSKVG